MKDFQIFEKALMGHLTDFRLKKVALKKYSSAIVELRKNNIQIDRIWKYGIPAPESIFRTDGVGVRSRIDIKDLGKLNEILKIRNIHSIKVFPLGIIAPEALEVQFKIGEDLGLKQYGI